MGHSTKDGGTKKVGDKTPKTLDATKANKVKDDAMLFKNWFLNALRDEEVRKVIKHITADAIVSVKVTVPEGRVVELERELAARNSSLKAVEDQANKVTRQLEKAERECEKARAKQKESEIQREDADKRYEDAQAELRSAKSELRKLQGLSAMSKAFELYQKLPMPTRKALNGVINGKDLLSFVCSGTQESNLDQFWDLCNEAFIDGDNAAVTMAEIFNAFFDLVQTLGTVNVRERLSVNSGDRFDNDLCTRIAHSAPTGPIATVLLQGYRYCVSKKVIKKSLVRV